MLLIIQIILTVKAWRNGYKAWALLPVGCAILVGFLIALSDPVMAESDDFFSLIWLDILSIGALGWMIAKAKEPEIDESKMAQEEKFTELTYDQTQSKLPLTP